MIYILPLNPLCTHQLSVLSMWGGVMTTIEAAADILKKWIVQQILYSPIPFVANRNWCNDIWPPGVSHWGQVKDVLFIRLLTSTSLLESCSVHSDSIFSNVAWHASYLSLSHNILSDICLEVIFSCFNMSFFAICSLLPNPLQGNASRDSYDCSGFIQKCCYYSLTCLSTFFSKAKFKAEWKLIIDPCEAVWKSASSCALLNDWIPWWNSSRLYHHSGTFFQKVLHTIIK